MTWRQLLRNVLLASIPLHVALWVSSCMWQVRWTVGSATRMRGVLVHSATVEFFSMPQQYAGAGGSSRFQFQRMSNVYSHPMGRFGYHEMPYLRREDYSTGPPVAGMPPSPMVEDRMWALKVPVWVLWFPFAGAAVAFCWMMERRSQSGKEKEQATRGQTT